MGIAVVLSLVAASSGCVPIANLQLDVPPLESLMIWHDENPRNCAESCESKDDETGSQCVNEAKRGNEPSDESIGVELAAYSSGLMQTAAGAMMSVVGTAGAVVGSVANYFIPVSAIAPPDGPPPGRFHPVPTTPVFAPRL